MSISFSIEYAIITIQKLLHSQLAFYAAIIRTAVSSLGAIDPVGFRRAVCLWKEELSACLNVIQCAKSKATTSWNRWFKVLQFIAWNNLPNRTFLQINEGIALRERCHLHWLWCKHAAQTKAQFVNVASYLGSSTIQTSRAFAVYVTESETRKVTLFLFQITNIVCIH